MSSGNSSKDNQAAHRRSTSPKRCQRGRRRPLDNQPSQSHHHAPPPAAPTPPPASHTSGGAPGSLQRPSPRTASRTPLLALAGVLAVVVLAGGGYLLGRGGDAATSTSPDTTSAELNGQGENADVQEASGEEPPTDTDTSDQGSEVASSIYGLIQDSSRDKASIQAAARELTSCGDLEGAAATFDAAEASRNTLAERASELDLSTLPEAAPLVDELVQAWHYSAQADAAFADAARYSPCDNSSSELASATDLSTQSHPHKDEAARLWNEIASSSRSQPSPALNCERLRY